MRDELNSLGSTNHDLSQELPSLPRGWAWTTASEVVNPEAPIVYGILQPGRDLGRSRGVPYIRGSELHDGYILTDQLRTTTTAIAERYAKSALRGGDVLVGLVRHPRVAVVPAELEGANITKASLDSDRDPWYLQSGWRIGLRHLQLSAGSTTMHRGINMPGLNLRDVRRLPIPLAPVSDQVAVVEALEERAGMADDLAAALRSFVIWSN